eukprot:TRINITY_DN74187_c0_g1_i1.p1 TRINITY_DN74187_c0_g1~~TRINITY_DN74187_c0_g1_i1.p1  ORF type:complete len:1361 (+),score=210.65 TRINITY_DN74187_c0_g1_i1:155-4237(+)
MENASEEDVTRGASIRSVHKKQNKALNELVERIDSRKSLTLSSDEPKGHHGEKGWSIISAIISGVVNYLLMFGLCCAYGMIMFNETPNKRHRGLGVKMNLGTAMIFGLLLAFKSKVGVAIGGPDLNPVVFIATFVETISRHIADDLDLVYPDAKDKTSDFCYDGGAHFASNEAMCQQYHDQLRATTIFAVSVSTLVLGLIYAGFGYFKMTRFVSYVPTSIQEAFLSCVGYKVFKYALKFCHYKPEQFVPAAFIGVVLYFLKAMHVGNPAIVIPSMLLFPLLVFYIVIFSAELDIENLREYGASDNWMFPTIVDVPFYHIWTDSIGKADCISFSAWTKTIPDLVVMLIVCTIDCMLKIASTETKLPVKVDKNYEAFLYGTGNLLTTLCGSTVGYMQLKFNVINYGILGNVTDYRGAIVYALLCGLGFFWTIGHFNLLPQFFLSTLLFFAGAGFVAENLWGSRKYLSFIEWVEILIILAVFIISEMLLAAVVTGGLLACFSFMLKYASISCISGQPIRGGELTSYERRSVLVQQRIRHVADSWLVLIRLKGFVFVASVQKVTAFVKELLETEARTVPAFRRTRFILFDCKLLDGMDASGAKAFSKLVADAASMDVRVFWSSVSPKTLAMLRGRQIISSVMDTFGSFDEAIHSMEETIVSYLREAQGRFFEVDPMFEVQHCLRHEAELFSPFNDIFLRPSAHHGCPWRYCSKIELVKNVTLLWSPHEINVPLFLVHTGRVALFTSMPPIGSKDEWPLPIAIYGRGCLINHEFVMRMPSKHYALAIGDGEAIMWDIDQWRRMSRERTIMSAEISRAVLKQQSREVAKGAKEQQEVAVDVSLKSSSRTLDIMQNIPEEVMKLVTNFDTACAMGKAGIYDLPNDEVGIMFDIPGLALEDLRTAFDTFCVTEGDRRVMKFEQIREALLFAGVSQVQLVQGVRKTLTESEFLALGHEGTVVRFSEKTLAFFKDKFAAGVVKLGNNRSWMTLRELVRYVLQPWIPTLAADWLEGLVDEWTMDDKIDEMVFLAVMSRLAKIHEFDWLMLNRLCQIVGSTDVKMDLTATMLSGIADRRLIEAEEMLWAANWRQSSEAKVLNSRDVLAGALVSVDKPAGILPNKPVILEHRQLASLTSVPTFKLPEADVRELLYHNNASADEIRTEARDLKEQALRDAEMQIERRLIPKLDGDSEQSSVVPVVPLTLRGQLRMILEAPEYSLTAQIVSIATAVLITLSILLMIVKAFIPDPKPGSDEERVWFVIELILTVIFTLEFILRLAVADSTGEETVIDFLRTPANIVDIVAIMPFYVELAFRDASAQELRLLRIVRMLRLSRIARVARLARKFKVAPPVTMVLVVIWFIYMKTDALK